MTDTELDAIEARANAATEGPWGVMGDRDEQVWADRDEPGDPDEHPICDMPERENPRYRADATFIAAARTDVPALVAALREARVVLREVALIAQDVAERNHASARWRMGEVARAALARVLGAATASPRRA